MNSVTDEKGFIEYVERMIKKTKERNKNYFGIIDMKFEKPAMAYNAKKYFEDKEYIVELRKCHQCETFEMIFSWSNQ